MNETDRGVYACVKHLTDLSFEFSSRDSRKIVFFVVNLQKRITHNEKLKSATSEGYMNNVFFGIK